ncbi:MAG: DUF2812 domain-containing protein [Clostridia bacterium]|nr:DUF2812 domain-containing protein [Clostridia bacterium]
MKNKVIWKFFGVWAWEEEEIWLNSMSEQGWQLIRVKGLRYEFAYDATVRYIYRLEALERNVPEESNHEYITFVEETGAELIGHYLYWAYFRRNAAEGPFEMFSNVASRLEHMKRFEKLPAGFIPILILNLINMMILYGKLSYATPKDGFFLGILTTLLFGALVLVIYATYRLRSKRAQLEKERKLHE